MIWWGVCVCVCVCSPLCLQVGNRLGFWGGFICFVSFIWCQLFAWLIRAAIFRLASAFVVWSFFLCHRHLWSVLSFFATGICIRSLFFAAFYAVGIRVRPFGFALFQDISVSLKFWYHAVRLLLVSFILGDSNWIFSRSVTLWTALQIPLWSKPHLVFRHKVYEIALSEVLATQMGVTEAQHQSQLVSLNQLYNFSPHSIAMLWVACELLQFAAIQ